MKDTKFIKKPKMVLHPLKSERELFVVVPYFTINGKSIYKTSVLNIIETEKKMKKEALEALESLGNVVIDEMEWQGNHDFKKIKDTKRYEIIKKTLKEVTIVNTLHDFRNRWCKVKNSQELNEVCSYFINEVWKDYLKPNEKEK